MAGQPKTRARKAAEAEQVAKLLADPMWRLKNLYHIKSEDTGAVVKFTPYPEQIEVFNAVINDGHKRIIIPKARRRGMSTGIDVMMLDQAMTIAGFEGGIVDRNQADASKKLENIIKTSFENLPPFILEDTKVIKNNDDRLSFQVGGDTTSNIYAATGYRGGNCNFLHVSEWGWIQCEDAKRSEEIQTGAIQAARKGQIIVETTWKGGKHGHLWDYMEQSILTDDEDKHSRSWRHMFFPWHTDSAYTFESTMKIRKECEDYFQELEHIHNIPLTIGQKRWYQEEAWPLRNNRFGEYPSTLEECFKSPMAGVIYDEEMAAVLASRRITTIPVEKGLPVFASFDLGLDDATSFPFIQVVGKEIRVVGYYVSHRESIPHYGEVIKNWMAKKEVQDMRILLPHDGGRKSLETGKTLVQAFQEMGFKSVQAIPRITSVWAGINYVKDTFPYIWFDKNALQKHHSRGSKKFPSLGECLDNYHQAESQSGATRSMEPVHDVFSHGCDSLRTFCEGWQKGLIDRTASRSSDGFDADFKGGSRTSNKNLAGSRKWR
jgi:hypothetical protein